MLSLPFLESSTRSADSIRTSLILLPDYFQPLLWTEIAFGSVDDERVKAAVLSFLGVLPAAPPLAARIVAVRLAQPPAHPPRHKSPAQVQQSKVLAALCTALCGFKALEEVTLIGSMVAAFIGKRRQDVQPRLRSVVLAGPPSDLFLSLRNFSSVTSLHLDHPALATPAFLGRVHEQLEHVADLQLDHFALSASHPALALLLGGEFGRRLEALGIHLSPGCPTPHFPPQLLAQAPNVRRLSLSFQGVDVAGLPALAHLETLHLHGSHQSPETTHGLLMALAADLTVAERLPSLRIVQVDLAPSARNERGVEPEWPRELRMPTVRAALAEVGIEVVGPPARPRRTGNDVRVAAEQVDQWLAYKRLRSKKASPLE